VVAFRSADSPGRQSGLLTRCVLFCLLATGLMILDKHYHRLDAIRRVLSVVVYPLEVAVASPFEGWDWLHDNFRTRDALRADKARLEQELRMARFRLQRYDAMEMEVRKLRALRDNAAGIAQKFIVGDVMNVDLDAFRARIVVDKGARDGVFVGQAVLDEGGVFGQVANVSELTCEVILVSDPSHATPVQVNRNGLRTVALGTGNPNHLKLPYVSTAADVVKGDLLVTSGLGGIFPAGYPVGIVIDVRRDPAASLAEVDVQPAAALDRSRQLLFIWVDK
jgi:rod shape-determining protein MreC